MRLINPTLFKPHNLLVIGGIAVLVHILAGPLYAAIDNKGQ
jgi:hypothetical protein